MESNNTIQECVQKAIAEGKIKMRPKWHFVLKTVLFALGVFIVAGLALYLASFMLFVLRENGLIFAPSFGARGWYIFFVSLPWLLVLLLVLFIAVLELLVRHYAFAYRRPLIFSAIGILALIIVGAFSIETTSFHKQVLEYSERSMPMARNFYYRFEEDVMGGVLPGRVVALTENGFVMACRRGEKVRVYVNGETRLPPRAPISLGQAVVVFGERITSTIRAFGIKLLGN